MTAPSAGVAPGRPRIASIDIARGIVMVLMAIDHVRVYSGLPAGGPTPGIFFTRWITHFCAPAFVFLAGTGAFLHGQKLGDKKALAQYLATRGLLFVVLELTLIKMSWTFNVDYSQFILAGVIWMLGWCMVLMAGLIYLPTKVIGWLGVAIILFQQLIGLATGPIHQAGVLPWLWDFLYLGNDVKLGADGPGVTVLYVIVPWIGVMAAGYGFGAIVSREDRRKLLLRIGIGATAFFLIAAGLSVALRDAGAEAAPWWVRMLNQQKYPASQLFLAMTLGPTILFIAYAERLRGWVADAFATFGRVPMFYYLLHIPTIHVAAILVNLVRSGATNSQFYDSAPYVGMPPDQRWSLPLLYLVFAIVVALLYVPSNWYAKLKARRHDWWLRYI